jgi:hypothetical protein
MDREALLWLKAYSRRALARHKDPCAGSPKYPANKTLPVQFLLSHDFRRELFQEPEAKIVELVKAGLPLEVILLVNLTVVKNCW